jgi:hypothetical protein
LVEELGELDNSCDHIVQDALVELLAGWQNVPE